MTDSANELLLILQRLNANLNNKLLYDVEEKKSIKAIAAIDKQVEAFNTLVSHLETDKDLTPAAVFLLNSCLKNMLEDSRLLYTVLVAATKRY